MAPFRRSARHRPVSQRAHQDARRQQAIAEARAQAELVRFRYLHLR